MERRDPSLGFSGSMAFAVFGGPSAMRWSGCLLAGGISLVAFDDEPPPEHDARRIHRRTCGYCGRLCTDEAREVCLGCGASLA